MISDYPVPFIHLRGALLRKHRPGVGVASSRWHYATTGHPRTRLITAFVASAAVHAAAFLFIGPTKEARPKVITNDTPVIAITMPQLQDLEDVDRVANDNQELPETATVVPMQADLPQVAASTDFIQKVDFNSLIDRPDMSAAKVFAVPENIDRGANIRQSIGAVFNLSDLDRIPEALVRVSPIFPPQYKRDVLQATVRVQFIVDTNGLVVNPVVVDTTHTGFNDAALVGVSKWKFRPGWKAGRRVNTRMEVPIVFKITEE